MSSRECRSQHVLECRARALEIYFTNYQLLSYLGILISGLLSNVSHVSYDTGQVSDDL